MHLHLRLRLPTFSETVAWVSTRVSTEIGHNIQVCYTPTRREGSILQSPCPSVRPSVRLSVRSHFRNRYLSFYWKKWFYIWYMALAWWRVLCLPFPGLPHIYFLFTVQLTNERVGVFLARRSVQHLVLLAIWRSSWLWSYNYVHVCNQWLSPQKYSMQHYVIKSVSGLRQVGGFVRVLRFPPPVKLTVTI